MWILVFKTNFQVFIIRPLRNKNRRVCKLTIPFPDFPIYFDISSTIHPDRTCQALNHSGVEFVMKSFKFFLIKFKRVEKDSPSIFTNSVTPDIKASLLKLVCQGKTKLFPPAIRRLLKFVKNTDLRAA